MSDVVEAAPSAAVENDAPIELPRSGSPEYAQWRVEGKLPEKKMPKPAASAPASPQKPDSASGNETDHATGSEPAKPTEQKPQKKHLTADERIAQLEATIERIRRDSGNQRKTEAAPVAEPAKPQLAPATRPKPTIDDKGHDGKPKYTSYEDFQEDLVDWKVEQRMAAREREQQVAQQTQSLKKQLEEARGRYTDFDPVTKPLIQDLLKPDVSREVFAVINDSPVLADLLYAIGGSAETKADFLEACRTNPGKALRVALLMEQEITKELAKGKSDTGRNENGQFTAKPEKAEKVEPAPQKKGPENTPAPPLEIGQRGGGSMDESERALKDIERGDPNATRAWLRNENAKEMRRRRGA